MNHDEEIRLIAYRIWEGQGRQAGYDLQHLAEGRGYVAGADIWPPGPARSESAHGTALESGW